MADILELETETISTYFSEEQDKVRSKGCHLMQIVEDLDARLHGSSKRAQFADSLQVFASLGFIWERIIGKALTAVERERGNRGGRGRVVRPGEQFRDGIYATPDGFNIWEWMLEEWKCTWRKCPADAAEFELRHWKWVVQVMAYCYLLETNTATIRVFYVMGDWNMRAWSGPQVKAFRLTFSDRELRENWEMVRNHKRTMEKEGTAPWMLG